MSAPEFSGLFFCVSHLLILAPQEIKLVSMGELPSYVPLRDYAVIGDCHGSALISRDGSVDWCCLGRFDAEPVFCRLLDAAKGGYLSVRPEAPYDITRAYLGSTNILRTIFTSQKGKVAVTDFMPVGRAPGCGVHDYVTLNAPFCLLRIMEGLEGSMRVQIAYRPTPDFTRRRIHLVASQGLIAVEQGPFLNSDVAFSLAEEMAEATVELRPGERRYLMLSAQPPQEDLTLGDHVARLLQITQAYWEEWLSYCRYDGPYLEPVRRSALILKLLTYAPTGALVAAPTTSLPETIGGERNWDYRYCWLRDATFTLYALSAIGYSGEARRFSAFLQQCCATTRPSVQIMYGIHGETDLPEQILEHLEGYVGSRPVRTGNAAFAQRQLDVYGEVLDWAFLSHELGARFGPEQHALLGALEDFLATHWQEPDQGIWEMRGPARHHVYGKIMSWVGIDRAIRMFGDRGGRAESRDAILHAVLQRGVDPEDGHLRQAFDERGTDAALLLVPLVGFPIDGRMVERTVDAVKRTLQDGDFVKRYVTDDDLCGREGAFLICSFWRGDALLVLDQGDGARRLYERLIACANDVGLYPEEIDSKNHEFLGNFPQAFTHLALIHSAMNLALYDARGAAALQGTYADRARQTVEATVGLRALWAAFKKSRRVGRLWSSQASILPSAFL